MMINPVILAVDDEKQNLFILKRLISDAFQDALLFTAESAKEGLEIARETKLDIVISDLHMPGMNGIEFCKALKASEASADVIVLLVTAYMSRPEVIEEALQAGIFDFMTKPIENQVLLARIHSAFRFKQAETEFKREQSRLEHKVQERTIELESINQRLKNEIQERERAETALRESHQQMLTAMEGTDEGFWSLDMQSGVVTYDANWARVLGYEAREMQFGADWWDEHVHPQSRSRFSEAMENYLSGREKYYETEYRVKTNQGKWIWVWSRGICSQFDEQKKPLKIVGTQRDITEKKKAEGAFQQLVTAIEQVEDCIIITDANANILYVNPAFEKVTGYDKESVLGENPRLLKSGVQSLQFYEEMWDTLTDGQVWTGRMVNRRRDGSLYDEEASITPVKNDYDEISNFIAVKRDVTERVKMERQLRQAQKMEAIGTLAGGIAHDFNNILFAIQGYNSLSLRMLADSHPIRSHLEKLGQAAERAKELVSQILTFSRQTEQKLRPVLMQPIIKEAMNLLRASIPSTIEVKQQISPEGGLIQGDITQIHQIIVNLATNAYHAMRESGGVLTVTLNSILVDEKSAPLYQEMNRGIYSELVVSDTGKGMSRETLERIFEPYFSTKEQGEGTGMGLSIVHGIVTFYKGKIFVESEEGRGSTFHVLIPEVDTMIDEEQDESIDESDLLGHEHILVVDDEQPISDMLKNMLEELGYTVDAFTSSERVLSEFSRMPDKYDAVITDMTMPRMTGAVLATRMLEIRPSIPIILCTGYSESIDEESAKELGISEFLFKPISIQMLAKTLKQVLTAAALS